LGADEVANHIEKGIRRVWDDAVIYKTPLVDGGEGFTKVLVNATNAVLCII
jgi:glycerate 2-kinase